MKKVAIFALVSGVVAVVVTAAGIVVATLAVGAYELSHFGLE